MECIFNEPLAGLRNYKWSRTRVKGGVSISTNFNYSKSAWYETRFRTLIRIISTLKVTQLKRE